MAFENWALNVIFHFTQSFLTGNILRPKGKSLWQDLFENSPGTPFFFDPRFSKFETESCPPSRKGGDWYCGGGGGSLSVKWIFNIKSIVPDSSKNFEGDSCLPLLDELGELWCTESHIELGVTFYGKGCQGTKSNLITYMERKKSPLDIKMYFQKNFCFYSNPPKVTLKQPMN